MKQQRKIHSIGKIHMEEGVRRVYSKCGLEIPTKNLFRRGLVSCGRCIKIDDLGSICWACQGAGCKMCNHTGRFTKGVRY